MTLRTLNKILQWTGFRVCRVIEADGEQSRWGVLGPVLPLTGWTSDYVGWPNVRLSWRV